MKRLQPLRQTTLEEMIAAALWEGIVAIKRQGTLSHVWWLELSIPAWGLTDDHLRALEYAGWEFAPERGQFVHSAESPPIPVGLTTQDGGCCDFPPTPAYPLGVLDRQRWRGVTATRSTAPSGRTTLTFSSSRLTTEQQAVITVDGWHQSFPAQNVYVTRRRRPVYPAGLIVEDAQH